MKTIFTTGQVAKMCKVAPRTVSKWFDSGRLRGYRIPGSQDRRIPREHLIRFLKEHGMPLGELDEARQRVLLVGSSDEVRSRLESHLIGTGLTLSIAEDAFSAGIEIQTTRPDCIIVDFDCGIDNARTIIRAIRSTREYDDIMTIAVLSSDTDEQKILGTDFNVVQQVGSTVLDLSERIKVSSGIQQENAVL